MSDKEKGANLLKVALVASIMTGVVFAGGALVAVKVLDRPTLVVGAIPAAEAPAAGMEKTPSSEAVTSLDGSEKTNVTPIIDATGPADAVKAETVPGSEPEAEVAEVIAPALEENPLAAAAGQALIEKLRSENDLRPAGTDARQWAAERLGYVPAAGNSADAQGEELTSSDPAEPSLPIGDEAVSGIASVYAPGHILVDGRSLEISGIVTPAISDLCVSAAGESFSCGSWALGAWTTGVNGRETHCLIIDGEELARCEIEVRGVPLDIGSWAVKAGAALSQQDGDARYLGEEAEAREAARGLWSVSFKIDGVENIVSAAENGQKFLQAVPEALPVEMIQPDAVVATDGVEADAAGPEAEAEADAAPTLDEAAGAALEALSDDVRQAGEALADEAADVAADLATTISDIAKRDGEAFTDELPANEDEDEGDIPAGEAAQ